MKMKNTITRSVGLYPLSIVVLPKESIRLHIYKSQFKALVNDCFASGKDFVIPFIFNGKMTDFGTCVKLIDVERFYPDGKMDIKVEGSQVVQISKINKEKNSPYEIGQINPIESGLPSLHSEELKELFQAYLSNNDISKINQETELTIYEITRNLTLSNDFKRKIFKHAANPIIQSKLLLNELRLLVLTQKLQSAAGFRHYMN
jgi:Lon protease-like protein